MNLMLISFIDELKEFENKMIIKIYQDKIITFDNELEQSYYRLCLTNNRGYYILSMRNLIDYYHFKQYVLNNEYDEIINIIYLQNVNNYELNYLLCLTFHYEKPKLLRLLISNNIHLEKYYSIDITKNDECFELFIDYMRQNKLELNFEHYNYIYNSGIYYGKIEIVDFAMKYLEKNDIRFIILHNFRISDYIKLNQNNIISVIDFLTTTYNENNKFIKHILEYLNKYVNT